MIKDNLQKLVDKQSEDESLWFIPIYITEDYLQSALRNLHAAIESRVDKPKNKKIRNIYD